MAKLTRKQVRRAAKTVARGGDIPKGLSDRQRRKVKRKAALRKTTRAASGTLLRVSGVVASSVVPAGGRAIRDATGAAARLVKGG